MRKARLRERAFKRVAFATTLGGLLVMAVGLQQGVLHGRWGLALVLLALGVLVALSSVFVEVVPEAGFTVTLYTREGCTLCDAARAFLAGKRSEYDFDVWLVDVDEDAAAGARFGDWVPVATVGDEELFRLAPDYARLDARLRALADARLRR